MVDCFWENNVWWLFACQHKVACCLVPLWRVLVRCPLWLNLMGLLRQVLIFVFVSRVAIAHCAVRRQRCMHRQVALSATERWLRHACVNCDWGACTGSLCSVAHAACCCGLCRLRCVPSMKRSHICSCMCNGVSRIAPGTFHAAGSSQ